MNRMIPAGPPRLQRSLVERREPTRGDPRRGLYVVVLAAGASRRFGRPKLLRTIAGESLLARSARLAHSVAGQRCVVVLGARASRLRAELSGLGIRVAVNRRWREGMGASLAAGIAALPADASMALVLLADQFALTAADLRRLLGVARRHPRALVTATWDGIRGAPAVLPGWAFARARGIGGDAGARGLLRDASLPVITVQMPSARFDLDVPADLERLGRRRDRFSRAGSRAWSPASDGCG